MPMKKILYNCNLNCFVLNDPYVRNLKRKMSGAFVVYMEPQHDNVGASKGA